MEKINKLLLKQMIAEAAYYRAERRNIDPDYAMQDWLKAEHTITASLKSPKQLIATLTPIEAPATAPNERILRKRRKR